MSIHSVSGYRRLRERYLEVDSVTEFLKDIGPASGKQSDSLRHPHSHTSATSSQAQQSRRPSSAGTSIGDLVKQMNVRLNGGNAASRSSSVSARATSSRQLPPRPPSSSGSQRYYRNPSATFKAELSPQTLRYLQTLSSNNHHLNSEETGLQGRASAARQP
ncbi:hypothetical protein EV182_006054, partial [Spiromyces aspiralis]